jgi:uncharacterized protein (DUF427 family)
MFNHPQPIPPQPGQESVWDYPRPPRLEPVSKRLRIVFNGQTIADTQRGYRVLETSHPPVYYLPLEDIQAGVLIASNRGSFCEWKGAATYWTVQVGDQQAIDVAWSYENPTPAFAPIQGYVAVYAGRMQACYVDDEQVEPQPGGFYGGWITQDIVGPFKGSVGSWGW